MVELAPSPVDIQDFQFKLHNKLKIFDAVDESNFKNAANLVASASRYGLVFVGSPKSTLEVIQTKTIEEPLGSKNETSEFARRSIALPSQPSHIALNCDNTLLAVVVNKNNCPTAFIYSVTSFLSQNCTVLREIRLSANPGMVVLETCWNPTMPSVYTACKADGSLGVYDLKDNSIDINELPTMAGATCFCWSPKGKQIVVGAANGTLTQYKPDLKAVKSIQAPALPGTGPFPVVNLSWLSNYQFMAIYKDAGDPDARPVILIVNAPKTGAISFINYEDICYSYGNLRPPQYYIIYQQQWGVILVASANSMEIGVLGTAQTGDPIVWQQWNQMDSARAELPLTSSQQETFPLGFAFDTGIMHQIPWGENQSLPPMPMLHIISHYGVLCSFNVINVTQGAAQICSKPEPIPDQSGINHFTKPKQSMASGEPKPKSTPAATIKPVAPQPTAPVQPVASQPIGLTQPAAAQPAFGQHMASGQPTGSPQTSLGGASIGSTGQSIGSSGAPTFGGFSFAGATAALSGSPATSKPQTNFTPFSAPSFGTQPSFAATTTSSIIKPTTQPATTAASSLFGGLSFNSPSTQPQPTFGLGGNLFGTPKTDNNSPAPSNASAAPTSSFQSPSTGGGSIFGGLGGNTPNKGFGMPSGLGGSQSTPKTTGSVTEPPKMANMASVNVPKTVPPSSQSTLATNAPKDSFTQKVSELPEKVQNNPKELEVTQSSKTEPDLSDSLIRSAIADEVKNFKKELADLLMRCRNVKLNVGTEDEKVNLVKQSEVLLEFYNELQDITDSQVAEVHSLKQALVQSFAWYEDAKMRHLRFVDPNFSTIMISQELDPVSKKQLDEIKHLIYYIDSQLKLVDGFLDNQWADFQDSCKKYVSGKYTIPTMEPIYQTMVRLHAILARQNYILKDISNKMKLRNKKAAGLTHVMNDTIKKSIKEISNTTDLDNELRKLRIDHCDIFAARYDKLAAVEKKFDQSKELKLCSYYTNRHVVKISPKKPKFTSSMTQSKLLDYSLNMSKQANLSFNDTQEFNNTAEANLSSTNIFTFPLTAGVKDITPQKEKLQQLGAKIAQVSIEENVSISKPIPSSFSFSTITNAPPLSNIQSSAVKQLNFGAPAVTSAKTVTFAPEPQKQKEVIKPQETKPAGFSFGNISITPVSVAKAPEKTSQPMFVVPEQPKISTSKEEKVILDLKTNTAKVSFSQPAKVEQKSIITTAPSSQTFTFTQPQSKPVPKDETLNLTFKIGDKTDMNTTFTFGSNLGAGQISTPKPKTMTTVSSIASTVAKPTPIISTPVATIASTPSSTPSAAPFTSASEKPTSTIFGTGSGSTFSFGQKAPSTMGSTAPSIFGSTAASAFGTPSTAETSSGEAASIFTKSIFGAQGSIFQAASTSGGTATSTTTTTSSSSFGTVTTTSSTIFGTNTGTAFGTQGTSIFGKAAEKTTEATTPSTPVSGVSPLTAAEKLPTTTPAIQAESKPVATTQSGTSVFGTQVTSTSVFGGSASASFGQATPAVATPEKSETPSVFGAKTTTASTGFSFLSPTSTTGTGSIFGSTTSSIFGGSTATTTTQSSVPTTTASIFGGAKTTEASEIKEVTFGFGAKPTETTQESKTESSFGFGAVSSSSDPNKFSFGNLTVSALSPGASSAPSTTGATTNTFSFVTLQTTAQSAFGGNIFAKAATTTSSFMGQPICSPSSFGQSSGSIFGQATGNIFAQKGTTTTGSTFGQSGGSIFGNASTTQSSTASIFGQTTSTPFGQTPATTTSSSIFGQSSTFGATTSAPTGSIFGQSTFGSPATTTATSFSFTQNAAFSSPTQPTSPGGSIFGAKPTFGGAPAFGSPATFGGAPAFGSPQSGGSIFGSPQTQTPQQPAGGTFGSGFGSPSAFGSPPSFGQTGFGAAATFGSGATFGSPQKVFGSPGGGGFGTGTVQENATFANLATQSTVGFGSLAQGQQAQPVQQAPQFSGGSQFSSWR